MGDRYYITGAQLGCLMAQSLSKEEIKKILNEIHEKQWIGKREDLKKALRNLNQENKK